MHNNLLSPQFSNKHQLFRKQRSPSFRTKRVPSVQEVLVHSQPAVKPSRTDSPKSTQEIRRKKSQLDNNPSSNKKKPNSQTKQIFTEIQDLKDQYKELKEAYKVLVQERVRHVQELNELRDENKKLKEQLQSAQGLATQNEQLKVELSKLEGQIMALKIESKRQETDIYFLQEKASVNHPQSKEIEKEVGGQGPRARFFEEGSFKTITNESQLLSFSLTSCIDDSIAPQPEKSTRRPGKQHLKVNSDFNHPPTDQSDKMELKKKEPSSNFKKQGKKDSGKGELGIEAKCSSALNPISQMLNLKSPTSADKKPVKNTSVTRRRRLQDRQNNSNNNNELRNNGKKKSKKMLQIE